MATAFSRSRAHGKRGRPALQSVELRTGFRLNNGIWFEQTNNYFFPLRLCVFALKNLTLKKH